MKYYIIAGEASGDLHGSNLIKELKLRDPGGQVRCWGGDKMQEAGGELVKHYRELAFMGFSEVLMNIRTIFRNLSICKKDILKFQPDALILIDYPGFNLRIAQWAKHDPQFKKYRCPTIYYISPQVWAWKENRVKTMKKNIDKMFVILPFEKEYFANEWNWDVEYVGHPLVEAIDRFRNQAWNEGQSMKIAKESKKNAGKPIIALLPGSRKQEIAKKLPVMLQVSQFFPDYHFVIAGAPSIDDAIYQSYANAYPNVSLIRNKTYDLLLEAKAGLVTSGTATLETALFGVPEVVCYKGSYVSYQIGKRLVKVKFISLVNLIMNRLVVNELIQDKLTVENLRKELEDLLHNEARIKKLKADYKALKDLLSQGGNASAKAASSILRFLGK